MLVRAPEKRHDGVECALVAVGDVIEAVVMFHALVSSGILRQNSNAARKFRCGQGWNGAEHREEIGERVDPEGVQAPAKKRADVRELPDKT